MEQHNGLIIGFSGKMQTGKTTAATYLANEYGFTRRSFASELRDITAYSFRISERDLASGDFKRQEAVNGLTWREVLIRVGQFYRSIEPDFWVNRMDFSGGLVTVDDVRFPNEAKKIKSLGGYLIRITRPGQIQLDDLSETALDNYEFDYVIDNDSDFLKFYDKLEGVLSGVRVQSGVRIMGQRIEKVRRDSLGEETPSVPSND